MAPFLASLCLAALRGQQETGLPECIDVTFRNRTAWNDHLRRPCSFYTEDRSTRCAQNTAAKVMCCACGGGTTNTKAAVVSTATTACHDFKAYDSDGVITWKDSRDFDCNVYKTWDYACENEGGDYANLNMTANDACCVCDGGFFDNSGSNDCVDKRFDNGTTWNDGNDVPETCAGHTLESCAAHGYVDYGSGKAIDMCCVCGGGTQSTADDDDDDALVIGLSVGGGVLAVALGAWAYRTYGNSNSKTYEAVSF